MHKEINPEYLTCPIRQVISRFGDKWSMFVLYTLDRSETGVMRFNELRSHMSDCSQKMLSKRSRTCSRATSSTGKYIPRCHRV